MKGEKLKNQTRKAERLLKDRRNSGFMHDPQNRTDIKGEHLSRFFDHEDGKPGCINPSLLHRPESMKMMEKFVTPGCPENGWD